MSRALVAGAASTHISAFSRPVYWKRPTSRSRPEVTRRRFLPPVPTNSHSQIASGSPGSGRPGSIQNLSAGPIERTKLCRGTFQLKIEGTMNLIKNAVFGLLLALFSTSLQSAESNPVAQSRTETSLKLYAQERTSSQCELAIEAARRRCALICGTSGYDFDPGHCGTGSRCTCGGSQGPGGPIQPPED